MFGKFIRKINIAIVNLVLLSVILCAFGVYFTREGRYTDTVFFAVILLLTISVNIVVQILKRKEINKSIRSLKFVLDNNGEQGVEDTISSFQLPLAFVNYNGILLWRNKGFDQIFQDVSNIKMRKILRELFVLKIKGKMEVYGKELSFEVELQDRHFLLMANVVKLNSDGKDENSHAVMIYLIDITEHENLKQVHNDEQLAIAEIVIDSYEEIYQSNGEAVINRVSVELGNMLSEWISSKGAIVRKMLRDRYILLSSLKSLKELEKDKFSILDKAKEINVGNVIPVTLSIGVSSGEPTIEQTYAKVQEAADLALSRGGDQVVVRIGEKDTFYGGSTIEIERRTKVKARVVSKLLTEQILDSDCVMVMGHSNGDMDALGSALAICRAANILNKKAYIILNAPNKSIEVMIDKLSQMPEYDDTFRTCADALPMIDEDKTLLVVVDTFKKEMTEAPKLLEVAKKVAVIDHHRRGADYIRNTVLDYFETYASSTSELIIEMLMYIKPNLSIPTVEAEAMYSGMLVDTKNFTFKTGTRTFEAASFLRSQGVDTISVRKYYQPDMDTFSQTCAVASSSRVVCGNIAIARCPNTGPSSRFIAALAADQMLTVAGIDASFVMAEADGGIIFISGRSLGNVNVQVILEKMRGGGHLTAAAARIEGKSIDQTEAELISIVEEYLKG